MLFDNSSSMGENSTDGPSSFEFDDYTQRVIVAALYLIISVLAFGGNSLVVLAVVLSRKVRTTTNAFVVNLSVADLLVSIVMPLDAAVLLTRDGRPFGEWVCSLVTFIKLTSLGCSMFSLAFIAINRLLLLTRPLTLYPRVYTPRKVGAWLAVTWLVPIILDTLPLPLGIGSFVFSSRYHVCGSNASHPSYPLYNIVVLVLTNLLPLIVIIVCYFIIWKTLIYRSDILASPSDENPSSHGQQDMGQDIQSVSGTALQHNSSTPQDPAKNESKVRAGRERDSRLSRWQIKVTKNMFYVVCAFVLCLLPYTVSVFFGHNSARPYLFMLVLFNSCVNPMIYAVKHRDFRAIFVRIVRCQWRLIPEPSETLKSLKRMKVCGCKQAW